MKQTTHILAFYFLLLSVNIVHGQTITSPICFNHALLVLDSATYSEAIQSTFLTKQFAYAHEKKLMGYQGFYLTGATNYLEIFHPNSVEGEDLEKGEIWICLASLKAGYLNQLQSDDPFIQLESEDDYNYLSLQLNDSTSPISTCEMKRQQYESWTKKTFHDSITFLPIDYNSPEEADSSNNYLMNDVIGIGLSVPAQDTSSLIAYLLTIGFASFSSSEGKLRFSNADNQFIELHITTNNEMTINRYYIRLNKSVERRTEIIGDSRLESDGKLAVWTFE